MVIYTWFTHEWWLYLAGPGEPSSKTPSRHQTWRKPRRWWWPATRNKAAHWAILELKNAEKSHGKTIEKPVCFNSHLQAWWIRWFSRNHGIHRSWVIIIFDGIDTTPWYHHSCCSKHPSIRMRPPSDSAQFCYKWHQVADFHVLW